MVDTLWRELRFALRGLFKDKSFAATAVLSIGLGVGANAAIFSLVNQALIRLLPVREPERLVLLIIGGLWPGNRMPQVLWVIAVVSTITVIHRIMYTWQETRAGRTLPGNKLSL